MPIGVCYGRSSKTGFATAMMRDLDVLAPRPPLPKRAVSRARRAVCARSHLRQNARAEFRAVRPLSDCCCSRAFHFRSSLTRCGRSSGFRHPKRRRKRRRPRGLRRRRRRASARAHRAQKRPRFACGKLKGKTLPQHKLPRVGRCPPNFGCVFKRRVDRDLNDSRGRLTEGCHSYMETRRAFAALHGWWTSCARATGTRMTAQSQTNCRA